MAYLSFISDKALKDAVQHLLDTANQAQEKAAKDFDRNVLDPFAYLFEVAGFKIASDELWIEGEKRRQAQKTLQNHIGNFHQKILGTVIGWDDLNTGGVIDLVCHERKIVAEVKNKFNTVKGSDRVKIYENLELLVMTKGHQYKSYTAYYVEVLPKTKERYNKEFTPSDNSKGSTKQPNALIRQIDGYSFYGLVTGVPDALEQLYKVLPTVIEDCSGYRFNQPNMANSLFKKAFFNTSYSKKS